VVRKALEAGVLFSQLRRLRGARAWMERGIGGVGATQGQKVGHGEEDP